jgi:hypothetical protein
MTTGPYPSRDFPLEERKRQVAAAVSAPASRSAPASGEVTECGLKPPLTAHAADLASPIDIEPVSSPRGEATNVAPDAVSSRGNAEGKWRRHRSALLAAPGLAALLVAVALTAWPRTTAPTQQNTASMAPNLTPVVTTTASVAPPPAAGPAPLRVRAPFTTGGNASTPPPPKSPPPPPPPPPTTSHPPPPACRWPDDPCAELP